MHARNRIDMNIVECDQILSAIIYLVENVDDYQTELLRHSTVTLSWCVKDKLAAVLEDMPKMGANH